MRRVKVKDFLIAVDALIGVLNDLPKIPPRMDRTGFFKHDFTEDGAGLGDVASPGGFHAST